MSSWGSCDKVTFNFGLFGGYAGPPNPRFVVRGSDLFDQIKAGKELSLGQYALLTERSLKGKYEVTASSKDAAPFRPGDLIAHSGGAAGGYGDVRERGPALVVKVLTDGLITQDVALKIYRVAINPQTGL